MQENWFLIGDIHGEAAPIERFYQEEKEKLQLDACKNHIILLGDVGCNYSITGERDARFKRDLSKMPFTYICLRGNHEARVTTVMQQFPEKWTTISKYGGTVYAEQEFPNIEYLEDVPAFYDFAGYKTFAVPGAYSVDKDYRLAMGWKWFPDEQLSEQEMEAGRILICEEKETDLVISHTCPIAYEPTDLFIRGLKQSGVDKTMERYLGEVEVTLSYKRWVFGHFHSVRLYPSDNGREKLMLFHTVVDLKKFMEMKSTDYLNDIVAG